MWKQNKIKSGNKILINMEKNNTKSGNNTLLHTERKSNL